MLPMTSPCTGTRGWRRRSAPDPLGGLSAMAFPFAGGGSVAPTLEWYEMRGVGERRRPGHFRICPSCGKRNKARRSACTRCREPLRGLPEAAPGAPGRIIAVPASRRNRWLAAGGVVLAIAAGFGVHRLFRSGTIAPAGQTLTTTPPDVPADAESTGRPASEPPTPTPAEVRNAAERGERLLARGDARGAASILSDAARVSPEDARIANAYGRALLAIGSRDRALVQFERAARLASGEVAYRLDYARALGSAGRAREAAREYEAVTALEPGNAAAAAGLAGVSSPAPGTEGASVDMGGASRAPVDLGGASRTAPADATSSPRPAGGVFTNEDLSRGAPRPSPSIPASLRSPSPRVIREGPSPLPSPSPS